jgi:hypothetical protein
MKLQGTGQAVSLASTVWTSASMWQEMAVLHVELQHAVLTEVTGG